MTDLTGKVALITGASRGLGKAVALRYARLGASVAVNYASDEAAALRVVEAIEAEGGRAIAVPGKIRCAYSARDTARPRNALVSLRPSAAT